MGREWTVPDPIITGLTYRLKTVTDYGRVVSVELTPVVDGANSLDDYGVLIEEPGLGTGTGESSYGAVPYDDIVPEMIHQAREHLASLKPVIDAVWLAHTGTTTEEVPS